LKVLLVQSPTGRREVPIYPIGLAFLAGQLRGHSVIGSDLSVHVDAGSELRRVLAHTEPDVVALSLRNIDDSSYPNTYSYVEPFAALMNVLEDWDGTVVVGGTGFSIYPEIILRKFPRIDYGLPGEGEETFPELLAYLEGKGDGPDGWRKDRLLPWGRVDLESLALPDYSVIDVADYGIPDAVGVQSRRGCPFGCTYCTYGYLGGRGFRMRPLDRVMEDIEYLEFRGVRRFQFVDSVFNAPREYFLGLLEALAGKNFSVKWSAWIDEKVTPDELRLMREAGAEKVDFSPDAITDRGLELLGKRKRAASLLPAVETARKAGLQVGVNFFNGNPGEGLPAFLRKLFFMLLVRAKLGWKDTFVNIGTIRVYAHSPLASRMLEEGLVPPGTDFYDPVFYMCSRSADVLYRFYKKLRGLRHG